MKRNSRFIFIAIVMIASSLLAACGSAKPATVEVKLSGSSSMPVEFVGQVEAIQDDQWTINGQVVQVSPEVVREAKFKVGDQVQVSAMVNADGSVKAEKVVPLDLTSASGTSESPQSAEATATPVPPAPTATAAPQETGTPLPTVTIAPTVTLEPPSTTTPAPTNDSNGNENNNNGDDNGNDDHGDDNNNG
jgi:hypothetical protein